MHDELKAPDRIGPSPSIRERNSEEEVRSEPFGRASDLRLGDTNDLRIVLSLFQLNELLEHAELDAGTDRGRSSRLNALGSVEVVPIHHAAPGCPRSQLEFTNPLVPG